MTDILRVYLEGPEGRTVEVIETSWNTVHADVHAMFELLDRGGYIPHALELQRRKDQYGLDTVIDGLMGSHADHVPADIGMGYSLVLTVQPDG